MKKIHSLSEITIDTWGDIIASIYETAFDPKSWQKTLIKLAEPIDCHAGHLISVSNDDCVGLLEFSDGTPILEDQLSFENDIHLGNNPKANHVLSKQNVGFWSDSEFITDKLMRKHPHYNEGLIPKYDAYYSGGILLEKSPNAFTALGTFRRKSGRAFGTTEREYFQKLNPHLVRAIEVGRIQSRISKFEKFPTMLVQNVPAVCILGKKGRVMSYDERAREVFSNNDGITLTKNFLDFDDSTAMKLYHKVVLELSNLEYIRKMPQPKYINARRPSGKMPYKVLISPTFDRYENFLGCFGVAYIFSMTEKAISPADQIRKKFSLTTAETELVMALIDGRTLKEYAEEKGVSIEAPRYHLKNVFSKTDTARQSSLIIKINKLLQQQ